MNKREVLNIKCINTKCFNYKESAKHNCHDWKNRIHDRLIEFPSLKDVIVIMQPANKDHEKTIKIIYDCIRSLYEEWKYQ